MQPTFKADGDFVEGCWIDEDRMEELSNVPRLTLTLKPLDSISQLPIR